MKHVCGSLRFYMLHVFKTGRENTKVDQDWRFLDATLTSLSLFPQCLIPSNTFVLCVLAPSLQSTQWCTATLNLAVTTFIILSSSDNPHGSHFHLSLFPPVPLHTLLPLPFPCRCGSAPTHGAWHAKTADRNHFSCTYSGHASCSNTLHVPKNTHKLTASHGVLMPL